MSLWDFASHDPFAFVLVTIIAGVVILSLANRCLIAWNRLMRHLNIRRAGWPPAHCDADGDFKPAPETSVE